MVSAKLPTMTSMAFVDAAPPSEASGQRRRPLGGDATRVRDLAMRFAVLGVLALGLCLWFMSRTASAQSPAFPPAAAPVPSSAVQPVAGVLSSATGNLTAPVTAVAAPVAGVATSTVAPVTAVTAVAAPVVGVATSTVAHVVRPVTAVAAPVVGVVTSTVAHVTAPVSRLASTVSARPNPVSRPVGAARSTVRVTSAPATSAGAVAAGVAGPARSGQEQGAPRAPRATSRPAATGAARSTAAPARRVRARSPLGRQPGPLPAEAPLAGSSSTITPNLGTRPTPPDRAPITNPAAVTHGPLSPLAPRGPQLPTVPAGPAAVPAAGAWASGGQQHSHANAAHLPATASHRLMTSTALGRDGDASGDNPNQRPAVAPD